MKKVYLSLMAMITIVACTSEEMQSLSPPDAMSMEWGSATRRSYGEAVAVAKHSIGMLEAPGATTRSIGAPRTLNLKSGVRGICKAATRSADGTASNDTLLYVFNFNDAQGFAVVSASRQTEALIAVVENGSYEPGRQTGNPGFDLYMERARAYVEAEDAKVDDAVTRATSGPMMCKPVYDTVFYQKIEPRVPVRWGQHGSMGLYCPNETSGCVNTAIAQMLTYFKYPKSLNLTYSGRDVNTTTLDWNSICQRVYTYYGSNSNETDRQIGRLARQIGVLTSSSYGENGTGANIKDARSAFKSLGYQIDPVFSYTKGENHYVDVDESYALATGLAQNKLVYMRGERVDEKLNHIGHAWVIDGCYYVKAYYRLMATYDNGKTWSVYQEMGTYRTYHNHINWGWDGMQNGYFLSTVLDPDIEVQYDTRTRSTETSAYKVDAQYFFVWR